MQENDKKTHNNSVSDSGMQKKKPIRSIFSKKEINSAVRGFIQAWLGGSLEINFPTADELIQKAKLEKQKLDFSTASLQEIKGKTEFLDHVLICSGAMPTTEAQLQVAKLELFKDILCCRAGNRIKGVFLQSDLEQRVSKIERDLNATNKLVQEWIQIYRVFMKRERR